MARKCDRRRSCRKGLRGRCSCDPVLVGHMTAVNARPEVKAKIAAVRETPEYRALLGQQQRARLAAQGHPRCKLTAWEAAAIRLLREDENAPAVKDIAAAFGISPRHVNRIAQRTA